MNIVSIIKQNLYIFFKVFGAMWLVIESIALFDSRISNLGLTGYFGVILISVIITITIYFTRKKFTVCLKEKNLEITITTTDIIKERGSIVVAASDTFDTELGDIISPQSLLGQLQTKVYNSNKSQMDSDIEVSLNNSSFIDDDTKTFGKIKRYSLGTTAVLSRNNNKYFLPALNTMRSNERRVSTNLATLWDSLYECWNVVRNKGNYRDIHVPVFGTKYGRANISYNQMIHFIITSFLFSTNEESISGHLFIHIHKSDSSKIDYISIKSWLESMNN